MLALFGAAKGTEDVTWVVRILSLGDNPNMGHKAHNDSCLGGFGLENLLLQFIYGPQSPQWISWIFLLEPSTEQKSNYVEIHSWFYSWNNNEEAKRGGYVLTSGAWLLDLSFMFRTLWVPLYSLTKHTSPIQINRKCPLNDKIYDTLFSDLDV